MWLSPFQKFNKKILLCLVISLVNVTVSTDSYAFPRTESDLERMVEKITLTGLGPNDLLPLNRQTYVTVMEASMALDDNEQIFIIPYGPKKPLQQRSVLLIPQRIMVWHEVLNVIRQDSAFAVTYSPVAGALAVYNTKKNAYYLQLQADGSQHDGNSVLFDTNTNSLWSQLYGLSFFGTLKGTGLDILPSYWSSWVYVKEFFENSPNAKVLATPRSGVRRYGKDPYGSYNNQENYYFDDTFIYPISRTDTRLPIKTPILGLEMDNNFLAIDLAYVRKKKFVNFFFGSKALLAVYDDRLNIIRVFDRTVWNGKNPLIFKLENDTIIDFHTRSTWNLDGECTSGGYLGGFMKEYFGVYAFWFSWAAHNPETSIIPGDTVVPDSALNKGIDSEGLGKGLKPKGLDKPF